jgi:hypothetical protein
MWSCHENIEDFDSMLLLLSLILVIDGSNISLSRVIQKISSDPCGSALFGSMFNFRYLLITGSN